MSRIAVFSSPFLLGFGEIERLLDRAAKAAADGYPPYNIERLQPEDGSGEKLRVVLAVAGFAPDDLEVSLEHNQLIIRGEQGGQAGATFLHHGIAARRFQRTFVLADGMDVVGATMENGLLLIDLVRPEPARIIRKIEIRTS
ncbi:MAG: Hsp20 family protein [Aestuariivirgaceae bacterium]